MQEIFDALKFMTEWQVHCAMQEIMCYNLFVLRALPISLTRKTFAGGIFPPSASDYSY